MSQRGARQRRGLGAAALVSVILLGAMYLTPDAQAAPSKRCGTIVITAEGMLNRVTVTARGVTCRYARRFLLRQKRGGGTPRGWRCSAEIGRAHV